MYSEYPTANPVLMSEGEKSISLGLKSQSTPIVKRDVEQEADSANGKTPFYLFKKNFYHPNTRRYLTSATTGNGNTSHE